MVPILKNGSDFGSDLEAKVGTNIALEKRLKKRRKELGISQEELGKIVGVSTTSIQNWEAGTWPKGDYVIALAEALNCSLDWLLMNKGPEPRPPGMEKQIDKLEPLYNKVEAPVAGVSEVEYNAGVDLKDKLIRSQEKLIAHLEKECNDLKSRLKAIKKRLSGLPNENIGKKAM